MGSGNEVLFFNCILEMIFKYLKADALKRCREVHSVWNKEAKRLLKQKTCIKLHDRTEFSHPKRSRHFPTVLSTYIEEMKNFGHTSFCLNLSTPAKEDDELFDRMKKLLKIIGQDIKELKLEMYFGSSVDTQIFYIVMNGATNFVSINFKLLFRQDYLLKVKHPNWLNLLGSGHVNFSFGLQINRNHFKGKVQNWNSPSPFSKIVKLAQISYAMKIKHSACQDLNGFLKAVVANKTKNDLFITRVSIKNSLNIIRSCKNLVQWPICLKRLSISGSFFNLQELLNKHADSLEQLDFKISPGGFGNPLQQIVLPRFTKLRVLNISCIMYCSSEINFLLPPVQKIQNLFPLIKVDSAFLFKNFWRYHHQNRKEIKAYMS